MRLFRAFSIAAAIGVLIFLFLPSESWVHDLWQVGFGWSGSRGVVVSMRQRRPSRAAAWYLFAAGVFLNATGILLVAILGRAVGPEAVDQSGRSRLLLDRALPLPRRRHRAAHPPRPGPASDKTTLVDTVIISTALALLSWVYVIRPLASDPTVTLLARMVVVAYPIGDIVLLAMVVRLLLAGGRRNHEPSAAGAGAVLFPGRRSRMGDRRPRPTLTPGPAGCNGSLETITIAAYALVGVAGLHPSVGEMAQPVGPQRPSPGTAAPCRADGGCAGRTAPAAPPGPAADA